jgi:hypothetical protein
MGNAAATFPSVEWFRCLAARMEEAPERYRKLGPLDLTLVPRIVYPDGGTELYELVFRGLRCVSVARLGTAAEVCGDHPVLLEGEYVAWREMVDNIREHGGADLSHTLNYLTLPDWPLRIVPLDAASGQLDADRFYRYIESLQEFFNEAAHVETCMAA